MIELRQSLVPRRTRAIIALHVCSALLAWRTGSAEPPGATERPGAQVDRVLLITIDTLRADHVGAYGGPVPTPAIDGLAREGVRLTSACTSIPSTGPAHASLLTGLYPWRHGVLDNAVPLSAEPSTLASHVRQAGIATAAFVASYILHERFGFARDFDTYRFEPSEPYVWRGRLRERFWTRGGEVTDAALRWLEAHRDEPFLLWVHYFDPHHPYRPPDAYARPETEAVAVDGKDLPRGVGSYVQLRDLIRAYRGEVAYTDAQVGRLVAGLRRLALLDRTALIVTADHGEGLGDHGLLQHGENLFDELVRIPLVIRAPGLQPGRSLAGAAQLEDLMPTILSLLGLSVPEGLDGRDLLAWVRGSAASSPRPVVVGRRKPLPGLPDLFFARSGPSKWIGRLDRPGLTFHLDADPEERRGARGTGPPPGFAAALETGPRPATQAEPLLDEESRRALEALGYVE